MSNRTFPLKKMSDLSSRFGDIRDRKETMREARCKQTQHVITTNAMFIVSQHNIADPRDQLSSTLSITIFAMKKLRTLGDHFFLDRCSVPRIGYILDFIKSLHQKFAYSNRLDQSFQ